MSSVGDRAAMKELLKGISDAEVRELCIEALRTWRKSHPNETQAAMHGALGRELFPLLMRRRAGAPFPFSGVSPHEALLDAVTETGMEGVSEFVNWFVGAGLAWPLGTSANQYPITLHLTRSGLRFLDGTKDHPLLPGFVDRIAQRCPNLPDDVLSLLVDARSCLDHGLMRPAIQLMGVAYEVAIEHVVGSLVTKAKLNAVVATQKAASRIAAIKAVIDQVMPNTTIQEKEGRFAVQAAYDFADQLRRRRNDAAHTTPKYDFADREEAEEFLVSAGRHLPNVWRML
jgi:hypothetical protein